MQDPSADSLGSPDSPASPDSPDGAAWAREVARRFDLGRPAGPAVVAARGQQGVVRSLVTDRGRFAVKVLLEPLDEADAAADAAFCARMADRGVLAPRPVRTTDGAVIGTVGEARVRVATWVDLDGPRTDLDPVALGTLFGTLHRDPVPATTPVDPWYTEPVPAQEWDDLATELARARCPFAGALAADVPRLVALGALFRAPVDPQVCHSDLWADNVRGTPSGRLAVVDWDNSGPAEVLGEVCVGLVEYCRRGDARHPDADDRVRAFLRAYRAAGGSAVPRERADFTMVLAQFGHFAHLAGRRWLAATTDAQRQAASDWFHEEHDDPVDVATLDRLLIAARSA